MPRGGFRENAGRKGLYGEKTVAVKVPASRVEEVKAFLRGELLVTQSNNDSVTEPKEQNDLVTETKIDEAKDTRNHATRSFIRKILEIEKVAEKWEKKCTPERAKAARWEKATELLSEIQKIIN